MFVTEAFITYLNSINLGATHNQCAIFCVPVLADVFLLVFQEVDLLFILNCFAFTVSVSLVPVATTASVAILLVHNTVVVAKSSDCITKFVPSYINSAVPFALITQVCGSFPSSVFMFFAHKLLIFMLQAPVFVVVNLQGKSIPVV